MNGPNMALNAFSSVICFRRHEINIFIKTQAEPSKLPSSLLIPQFKICNFSALLILSLCLALNLKARSCLSCKFMETGF